MWLWRRIVQRQIAVSVCAPRGAARVSRARHKSGNGCYLLMLDKPQRARSGSKASAWASNTRTPNKCGRPLREKARDPIAWPACVHVAQLRTGRCRDVDHGQHLGAPVSRSSNTGEGLDRLCAAGHRQQARWPARGHQVHPEVGYLPWRCISRTGSNAFCPCELTTA